MSSNPINPFQEAENHFHQNELSTLQAEFSALQERFNYVLKATKDVIWDWDLQKNTAWYSDALQTLFGYSTAEPFDGVSFWYDTIHPDDKVRVISGIHAAIDRRAMNWSDRYRFRRADGTFAWVYDRGYLLHGDQGKAIRMVGSMQDITSEVKAAEALRESEEKFRGIFNQAGVGICIIDLTGKFVSVNKVFPKMFGYTEEEFLTMNISELSHDDEIAGDKEILQQLLGGQTQVKPREKKYVHKSGKTIWGRVLGTVIRDANNNPTHSIGVLEDVTEQREAIDALRENEERLRFVIEAAEIGTWDFDPRTGRLFWDARCKALFGMNADDHADYEVFLSLLHPDDRQMADEANRNAIEGKGSGEYDLEYRTIGLHDKKLRWVRARGRSFKDANGVTYRYAGTVMDITEEKEKDIRIQEEENRFRVLVSSIPQIVWSTDETGKVNFMSDKWTVYTGHDSHDQGDAFRELIHPEDAEAVVAGWKKSFASGSVYQAEYRLRNKLTGEYRWFSCTIAPVNVDNTKVRKWVGSATDIHEQKSAKEQLEAKVQQRTKELTELNRRLEKSNSELEQYAYVTSHDLKEPLRKIQMFNDLIVSKYSDHLVPDVLTYLGKVSNASIRMAGLIDDLLAYSRLSDPFVALENVDLAEVVNKVADEFEVEINQRQITLDIGPLPQIQAVKFQMHQLFSNLFSNSIKFSKPESINKITVRSSVASPTSDYSKPGHFKITFADEGIGFSEQYKELIFTIFQRLNSPAHYSGHGIGLSLCRKIVVNHQGSMFASGEEGKGASFTILLPEEQS